jgi:hypothetical protein
LASSFPRAINVKDHPSAAFAIHQPSGLLVRREGPREQIVQKEGAQRFDGFLRQRC